MDQSEPKKLSREEILVIKQLSTEDQDEFACC